MIQFKVLQWAFSFLQKHGRETVLAEHLLQELSEQSPSQFYANMREPLDEALVSRYKAMIKEHAITGRPIQHMIGSASFYGRSFYVNEDVLIPRLETEELVAHVLERIQEEKWPADLSLVDLGTGSGVIAISLALALEEAEVYASDLSERALAVAKKNARRHGAQVDFFTGDFLEPIRAANLNPDIIVSNPPYIAHAEKALLSDTVKDYDPALALFADQDGLAAYQTIMDQLKQLPLPTDKLVVFEIGYRQAAAVKAIMTEAFPNSQIDIIPDINGHDRILSARIFA